MVGRENISKGDVKDFFNIADVLHYNMVLVASFILKHVIESLGVKYYFDKTSNREKSP